MIMPVLGCTNTIRIDLPNKLEFVCLFFVPLNIKIHLEYSFVSYSFMSFWLKVFSDGYCI